MTHTERSYEKKPTTSTSRTSSSTTTTTSSSSTTTGIPTPPGVLTSEQWEELRTIYEGCGLGLLTMPVSLMIQDFNRHGMTYEVIREAIFETGFAPRPSAHYLRAVLTRASGDDIETLDEWNAAKAEYEYHIRKKWYRPSWEREL